ncbi:MAG: glycosyl transferase family 2, partial [Candidatus Binatus sp.]|nr:glycosyl transferase family 2 [Candidatus Binatus sp.]
AEITDWAFGLTQRDRTPKRAFETVSTVYRAELPSPFSTAPKASVIVCAYNAAATLAECLKSLRELKYPDYELIVVDDGSTDSTAQIAEQAEVRMLRLEHRGLACARNAGVEAASGDIVAFIDADARADRDWLYHLVETITRRGAAAAGGPNFTPHPESARAAAMSVAPGLPREVRAEDDRLSQLCGCNMAITKAAFARVGSFDPVFTAAGDDVDLSWRLTSSGETIAHAPGAVVTHERRGSLSAYMRQQRGYGVGEGRLFRKYPRRTHDNAMYAAPSWLGAMLGGARVYYGEFGRGLFQTVYSSGAHYAELPLTIQWVGSSIVLLLLGFLSPVLGLLGVVGFSISILIAVAVAISTPLPSEYSGVSARIYLWLANLLGPVARSLSRERVKWRLASLPSEDRSNADGGPRDSVDFAMPGDAETTSPAAVLLTIRDELVRRGLTVAESDGFQSYDLEVILPPFVRVPINAIRERDRRLTILWREQFAWWRASIVAATILLLLIAADLTLEEAVAATACVALAIGLIAVDRTRRVVAIVKAGVAETARKLGIADAPPTEVSAA